MDKYRLLACSKCGLVYLDKNYYTNQVGFIGDARTDLGNKEKEKVEYWSFPALYKKHYKVFKKFFDERFRRIRKHHKNVHNMLDIGCGYGFWMDYCEKRGIESAGIDISREAVDFAKGKLKLNVLEKSLVDLKTDKKYDLLMLFDIVEHFEDPNEALAACKKLLNRHGLVYIQVPNLLGFKVPMNHGYGLPYHLWQFSFKSLRALLRKNGFTVVGHWTGPMGVIGEYEKNKYLFLKKMMWAVSSKLHMGNRLQVIAKVNCKQ